jgi:hypothetical protein
LRSERRGAAYRGAAFFFQGSERAEKRVVEAKKLPRAEALKAFRKNLKAGDRVQWKTSKMLNTGTGTVVRLDGDLALVQFDSEASAGKSVRYIKRSQLEPADAGSAIRQTAHGR